MEKKFLGDLKDSNEQIVVEVFIVRIYSVKIYFCDRCNSYSEEKICINCGNFPKAKEKITGLISDGTSSVRFTTANDGVFQKLSADGSNDRKEIMSKSYVFLGRVERRIFLVEDVILEKGGRRS